MEKIDSHIEILITEDGSSSLRRKDLQEGYHSTHGAIAESQHIFINAGLKNIERKPLINILEIGFGTGLNALLTCEFAIKEKQNIFYQTIEKYPLPKEITSKLNYGKILNMEDEFEMLHSINWEENNNLNTYFEIRKTAQAAEETSYKENFFDLIYFDAFAPQFEEKLWQKEVFDKLFLSMKVNACLVTYCCKGEVKRTLKASGFQIEKLPGPKGKREILRAKKLASGIKHFLFLLVLIFPMLAFSQENIVENSQAVKETQNKTKVSKFHHTIGFNLTPIMLGGYKSFELQVLGDGDNFRQVKFGGLHYLNFLPYYQLDYNKKIYLTTYYRYNHVGFGDYAQMCNINFSYNFHKKESKTTVLLGAGAMYYKTNSKGGIAPVLYFLYNQKISEHFGAGLTIDIFYLPHFFANLSYTF